MTSGLVGGRTEPEVCLGLIRVEHARLRVDEAPVQLMRSRPVFQEHAWANWELDEGLSLEIEQVGNLCAHSPGSKFTRSRLQDRPQTLLRCKTDIIAQRFDSVLVSLQSECPGSLHALIIEPLGARGCQSCSQ